VDSSHGTAIAAFSRRMSGLGSSAELSDFVHIRRVRRLIMSIAEHPDVQRVADESAGDEQITIYGHSNLFYWWPVWFVGFALALLTYADGHVMAVVPPGSRIENNGTVLVAPPGQTIPDPNNPKVPDEPRLRVATTSGYGVIFAFTIFLVASVTTITYRGLASVAVIVTMIAVVLLFYVLGWWDPILEYIGGLDVRMNAGGYLAVALPLFLLWLFTLFVYDRQTYLIFARGQVRLRQEIGDGETALDATGLLLEKKRDDFFRHWLFGFGSGDIRVRTGGSSPHDYEIANVLMVSRKLREIQDMIKEREVSPQVVMPRPIISTG
jgi:hypothetical protein